MPGYLKHISLNSIDIYPLPLPEGGGEGQGQANACPTPQPLYLPEPIRSLPTEGSR